jgi:Flp pilus assembly protein CpaB
MNKKTIFIILLIILAIGIIGYLAFNKNPTPFASQEKCEQKTGKKCFLFKGLCQVMVAQNQRGAEENEKFLKDCEKKIGTWQPIDEQ